MKKFMNKKKKDNKGFSLVELVIVVAIMAILVGILAPQYIKYVERSRKSADASNIDNFATAVKVANADGKYTIPADTYTITIGKKSTTLKASGGDSKEIEKALLEYVGNGWAETKLKSSKWKGKNAEGAETTGVDVAAKCTVGENGSVTIEYTPSSVANFLTED